MNFRAPLASVFVMNALLAFTVLAQQPSLPTSAIDSLAKYSREKGGISFLLMQDGNVLREEYPNGGSPDRPTELASGTKSFSGVAALCAEADGLLDLDEPASKTLSEWQDDERRAITIRQLLSLSSGIIGRSGPLAANRVPSYKDAIKAMPNAKPGTKFQYGPVPYMIWGEILRRKLEPQGLSVEAYYEKKIFAPLGMSHGLWRKDADGNVHLPSGLAMTAREWAKFGEMVRLGGNGVLPPGKVKELFRPSPANAGYGLTWWIPVGSKSGTPLLRKHLKDVVMAAGLGGQKLYIIPSLRVTIVRQAPVAGGRSSFSDSEFLGLLAERL